MWTILPLFLNNCSDWHLNILLGTLNKWSKSHSFRLSRYSVSVEKQVNQLTSYLRLGSKRKKRKSFPPTGSEPAERDRMILEIHTHTHRHTNLAMLLMALLGVTFGTLSILAATVASFKAVGDGAEVRVLICTLTGETTLTLLRCTAFVRQELFMGSVWGLLVHNAGIKWFVVVWPTVLTSCTAEIPGLDDKAILVEYNVLEVPEGEGKKIVQFTSWDIN